MKWIFQKVPLRWLRGMKYPFGASWIHLGSPPFSAPKKEEVTKMRTLLIVGSLILFLFAGQVFAQPIAKHLIDAKPPEALLFDVEKWFQDHPIEKGNLRMETVFLSPRAQVAFIRGKGMVL